MERILAIFALIFLYNLWKGTRSITHYNTRTTKTLAPEPSGALPIIGHLHLLKVQAPLARTLGAIADKYGPAVSLRLGVHRALLISGPEVIKECFTTQDKVLASRPLVAAGKYLGYNYAVFGFAPQGAYWRELKKISTLQLLSKTRLDMLKHARTNEVDTCIKELYSYWVNKNIAGSAVVEMNKWFRRLTFNIITKLIAGKRYFNTVDVTGDDDEARRFERGLEEFAHLTAIFVVSDALPYLEWMDLQGHLKAMKRVAKEMDFLVGNWLEDHLRKEKVKLISGDHDLEQEDFIDVMLSMFPDKEKLIHGYDRDTVIKATVLVLIIGASESTFHSLTWALSLLLNHPHELKRVQDELDFHVGKDRNVEESDIKNLVYLQAIAKETFRLYPPGPVLPRQAMEDCQLGEYHVPKGTRLLVNIWKLHRDPNVWSNPNEFQPERFLTTHANKDFKGQQYEYIPFSAGRRPCPGIALATQVFHLSLARVLHGFDLMNPSTTPVDMSEGASITLPKATPLQVLLTPRLPCKLYEN